MTLSPPWTEQDIEYLKSERLKGIPFSKIAIGLDRSRMSVTRKANRIGLPHRVNVPPRPRSKSRPPPIQIPDEQRNPQALYLPLADLAYNQCRWPYGDDPFFFCAVHTSSYPYCDFHRKIAYRKPW